MIELAVVLVIVGILATAVTSVVASLIVNSREKATRTKQEAIKTALSTFVARNNRLPCPANRTLATGTAGNGVEAAPLGTCTGGAGVATSGVAPNIVTTGAIPWASLGLPEEASLDGYGNRFTYQVMAIATNVPVGTISGMLGNITIHSAGPGVIPPAAGANQINNCTTGTYNPCAAVAVIVSHGANGYGAFNNSGQRVPIPAVVTAVDEQANTDDDRMFVVKSYSDIAANPYDDILLAITADDLLTPLAQNGTLKSYQAELNEKMTVIKGAVIANAFAKGDLPGGERRYQFPPAPPDVNFPALPPALMTDPWGRPIAYFLTTTDKVRCSTTPLIATVFTLTSLGPDPNPAMTADDIMVTVTVADIIAIIARAGCNV